MLRKSSKSVVSLLFILIFLFSLCTFVNASEGTGSIDHVVIEVENNLVVVTIGTYGTVLAAGAGNEIYDYLSSGSVPLVRAIQSGDKFIGIGAYGTAFALAGNTAEAIAFSTCTRNGNCANLSIIRGF